MNKNLLIKLYLFVFTLLISFNVNAKSVSLNELYEIKDDNEQLVEVTQVTIEDNDNLKYVDILSKLSNLNYLYIVANKSFDDFTFINNINPNNQEFSITFNGCKECSINLDGINNQYLNSLYLSVTSISNFSEISKLKNLKKLSMDMIFNYTDIDYSSLSKLLNLEELSLQYIGISDYQQFFNSINQLNKLELLILTGTNFQNKDVKYLKVNNYLKELILRKTMITDISFLKDMPNIEIIGLPSHITDFSVLYELENIKSVWWDEYTEYNVTNELIQYLDSKGINHTRYFPQIRNTINELVDSANILDTDNDYTKVLKVMKAVQSFATIDGGYYPDIETGDTTLSKIILTKKGVCENWSALVDVMLNIVGVESYKVSGFMGMAHAWNIIKLDGKYYAIDIMNARPEPSDYFDISTWDGQTKAVMFRDPFRVDSYREIDAINNNLDYNYEYPLIYIETDGYDTTKMLYDFEVTEGVTNISQKNIWLDLNTNISSLNLVPISGYSYKYYDSQGNIKDTGIAETDDYIIVTSSNNANYSHKYKIIVEEKTYEIKLESDSFGKNESITVKNGEKYTGLFTPIKYCYKFLGWYTAKTGGTLITEDSIVDINKVDTLYARWKFDNKYMLTVHTSDWYESSQYIFESNAIYYNVKRTTDDRSNPQLSNANYASPSGKKFSGFYTEKDGGILLTYYSLVVTNANHEIYAHYVDENEKLYTVRLNCAGCNIPDSYTWPIEPNTKIAKFYNPTREGYTFQYWAVNGEIFDFNTPVTSDITLTVVWEKNEAKLIDILKTNGFSVNNAFVSKFTLGEDIEKIKNKLGNDIIIDSKTKIISTGAIIKKGAEIYSVVIKGDLTGDGKINSGDLLQMRKHLLEEITLTGAYKQSGIIESNNEIKSLDLLRLRQYLLGEYVFK